MKNLFLRHCLIVLMLAPFTGNELAAQRLQRIITTQTRLIRHEATEYQRKVAEARARAYVAAQRRKEAYMAAQRRRAEAAAEAEKKHAKQPKKAKTPSPKKRAAKSEKLPRYIAVDTVKDKRSSPKAKKAVMIFDTYAEELVGNSVYDVEKPPRVGQSARFETYTTLYVGTGR